IVLLVWWYNRVPTGFLPTEDQGYILISVQLPDAAAQDRTREVLEEIDQVLARTDGVATWISIGGLSLLQGSSAPNAATLFVTFKPWNQRLREGLTLEAIIADLNTKLGAIEEAIVFPFAPPAIRGLGV